MNMTTRVPRLKQILAAVSAALVFGPSHAQEGGATTPFFPPENSVSVGAGVASGEQKDRARFGLFNGLRKHDANGLLDFNYASRDAATGRWITVEGLNLGLDNRELAFTYRNLGDFKLKVDYGEITRHDPRTINTSLTGAGTTTPTLGPGTQSELNLELKRKGLGLDIAKRFGNFELEVTFKNEDKKGARQWGAGFPCTNSATRINYTAPNSGPLCSSGSTPTTLLMLPEPVDSTIRQFDAKLNYSDGKLNLSGGYYANFYTNNFGSLRPTVLGTTQFDWNGGLAAIDANLRNNFMQSGMALWPDSQAHQIFLGGNYKLTSHTKINFKYSYTHATQNESFSGMGLNPLGPLTASRGGTTRGDLGGVLNTTKGQLGFSSHPLDKLHVHGDVAFESKKNKTPVDTYNVQMLLASTNVGTWTNSAMSPSKFDAKLEASYKLPYTMLLVGGLKYERENTGVWTSTDVAGGVSALRQKMDSWSGRIELRKTMSDTFTGSVALYDERRDGASSWLKPNTLPLTGVFNASGDCASAGTNACVYSRTGEIPYTMKDMQRQKVRMNGNWMPMERLSLQGFLDLGSDELRAPTESGLQKTRMYNLSFDAAYDLSDNWKINAYFTRSSRSLGMGHAADYDAKLNDKSTTLGAGFSGTPLAGFKVGGDLMSIRDTLSYSMSPDAGILTSTSGPANLALLNNTGGLPDVQFNMLQLKLYGEYAVNKASSVRLDYIHHRTFFNEWTYNFNGTPFLFSDGTTLSAKERQSVNYIGARYVYKFQ